MLCRTASDLFWMGRVVERAEGMARLLDLARRLSALPSLRDAQGLHKAWTLPLLATGSLPPGRVGASLRREEVLHRCVLDRENPGSVVACLQMARDAARHQRSVVPTEVHATLQIMLTRIGHLNSKSWQNGLLGQTIADIQAFSDTFRGVGFATMLRNEAWHFMRLGMFFERADGAIRLWSTQADPDFDWLDPDADGPNTAFHRVALLESASALMPLRRLRGQANRDGVTEMLLRRVDFPRSATYCLHEASLHLQALQVNPSEPVFRALGRAQAGVSFADTGHTSAQMFAFGAQRLNDIAAAQAALSRRFFVASLSERLYAVAPAMEPQLQAA